MTVTDDKKRVSALKLVMFSMFVCWDIFYRILGVNVHGVNMSQSLVKVVFVLYYKDAFLQCARFD